MGSPSTTRASILLYVLLAESHECPLLIEVGSGIMNVVESIEEALMEQEPVFPMVIDHTVT